MEKSIAAIKSGSTPVGSSNPARHVVAFDTETYPFGPGCQAPKIVCMSWATRQPGPAALRSVKSGIIVDKEQIHDWLEKHLELAIQNQIILCGQYVAYDCACILSTFPTLRDLVFAAYNRNGITCTKTRERLLDIAEGTFRSTIDADGNKKKSGYSLGELSKKYWNTDLDKGAGSWRTRYQELDGVPLDQWPTEAVNYSISDAVMTFKLFELQKGRARRMGYSIPTQYHDTRADFALKLASAWGIRTDSTRVEQAWQKAVDRMSELAERLTDAKLAIYKQGAPQGDLFGKEPKREEPVKVKKRLDVIRAEVEKRHPNPPLTPGGKVQTGKEVLAECKWKPFDELIEYTALEKSVSTYLSKLFVPVVHANFSAVGAASDRTSCSSPNLQNQPRLPGVRECFVPRKGFVFLTCDFDSQEMRTLAQSCLDILGRSKLAERYKDDRHFDPHLEFAAGLAELEVDDAKTLLASGDKEIAQLRQQSKACNFGYPGGLGVETLVDYAKGWGIEITPERARELREAWLQAWPEMREFFRYVSNLVGDEYGTVTIPQSKFQRALCKYTDACNCYFQTLAAHASKSALWEVTKRCFTERGSALYGSRPVLFLHDEIILETPEKYGHEAAQELERVMVESMEIWTPDIPSAASATLMSRWSKNAKRIEDREGRLIAWTEMKKKT